MIACDGKMQNYTEECYKSIINTLNHSFRYASGSFHVKTNELKWPVSTSLFLIFFKFSVNVVVCIWWGELKYQVSWSNTSIFSSWIWINEGWESSWFDTAMRAKLKKKIEKSCDFSNFLWFWKFMWFSFHFLPSTAYYNSWKNEAEEELELPLWRFQIWEKLEPPHLPPSPKRDP